LFLGSLSTPWTVLSHFGYTAIDDQLILQIPPELSQLPVLSKEGNQIYELSEDATIFLLGLAKNAYQENARPIQSESDNHSEMEDCLTSEALRWILSVLPSDFINPWSNPPDYRITWPYQLESSKQTIEQFILLPGYSHDGAIITFDDWLTQWHLLALTDPILVQNLLFRLGYVDHQDYGIVPSSSTLLNVANQYALQKQSPSSSSSSSSSSFSISSFFFSTPIKDYLPRQMMNIYVLGDNRIGKSSFVFAMSGLRTPGGGNYHEDIEKGIEYAKPIEAIVTGGYTDRIGRNNTSSSATALTTNSTTNNTNNRYYHTSTTSSSSSSSTGYATHSLLSPVTFPYYLSITAIPLDYFNIWLEQCVSNCDLVLLMYQCDDMKSLQTVLDMEKSLPLTIPRVYLANKIDLLHQPQNSMLSNNPAYERVLQKISLHTQDQQLLPVLPISIMTNEGMTETIQAIQTIVQQPQLAIPKKENPYHHIPYYQQPIVYLSAAAISMISLSVMIVKYNQEIQTWVRDMMETVIFPITNNWLSNMKLLVFPSS